MTGPALRSGVPLQAARILFPGLIAAALVTACVASPGGTGAPTASPGASNAPSLAPSASPAPSESPAPSVGPVTLVLRITTEGGFIAPGQQRMNLPIIAIYADGSYFQEGAVPAIYPGPLVPALFEGHISAAGLTKVLDAARAAGLGTDASYPPHGVADAPNTVFTVVLDGRTAVTSFGALGMGDTTGLPAAEAAARTAALDLETKLGNLPAFLGADSGGAIVPYVPAAIRLVVIDGAPTVSDPTLARPPVAWPLSTPLATFGAALASGGMGRCGMVSGADAATLWPILVQATSITGFSSGGSVYTLQVRPLLPGESGC